MKTIQTITFTIPIIPAAQMRSRHRMLKTKSGKVISLTHKAKEQQRYEDQIIAVILNHRPFRAMQGPVTLSITAYLPIPRSWSAWKQEAADKHIIVPTSKPDLDNLQKNIMDCLTKSSYWRDDSQVWRFGDTRKLYSINPRWEITIAETHEPKTKREYEQCQTAMTL